MAGIADLCPIRKEHIPSLVATATVSSGPRNTRRGSQTIRIPLSRQSLPDRAEPLHLFLYLLPSDATSQILPHPKTSRSSNFSDTPHRCGGIWPPGRTCSSKRMSPFRKTLHCVWEFSHKFFKKNARGCVWPERVSGPSGRVHTPMSLDGGSQVSNRISIRLACPDPSIHLQLRPMFLPSSSLARRMGSWPAFPMARHSLFLFPSSIHKGQAPA